MNTIRRKIDFVWNIAKHTAIFFTIFLNFITKRFIQIKIFEKQISCLKNKLFSKVDFHFFNQNMAKSKKNVKKSYLMDQFMPNYWSYRSSTHKIISPSIEKQ